VKKLKVIPSMHCDAGCGECCGIVPAEHSDGTCPFYQNGGCAIYPVRPLVCRLFGHSGDPLMTCPRGYNVNVAERDVVRMLIANGKTTHVLHELAPNWQAGAGVPRTSGSPALR
jgi:Fe-S-cluster containining protein